MEKKPAGFVAVHVGAGYHSPANSELYKQVCRAACLQALDVLQKKKSALSAVTAAIVSLEDCPWTNAGTGSNLTIAGKVECDASIMDGESLQYGGVGAVMGVKNPILVAEDLLQTQLQGAMSLGRIPPSTLVGAGAYEWAKRNSIETTNQDELITDASKRAFIKHKRKLDMLEEGINPIKIKPRTQDFSVERGDAPTDGQTDEKPCTSTTNSQRPTNTPNYQPTRLQTDRLLDTVGAVCVDENGRLASAVSSGGIVLKQPGRLGQAALYGCGCWAEMSTNKQAVGISTSGCGEHLTRTLLAKQCANSIEGDNDPTEGLSKAFQQGFLDSRFLTDVDQKLGGALAVKSQCNDDTIDVEVLWSHTTDSMCLAYMSTNDQTPKAFISRLPEGKLCGQSFVVQSKSMALTRECASDAHIQNGHNDES